jgi:SAM-dependent MidA family methyltransferase
MQLSEIIAQKINDGGPISFHDFMKMALYYPGLGYYTSLKNRIGPGGDYYTSPCVASFFGELIGKQIEEMWRLSGEGEFTIVEYGGNNGMLCNDILNQIRNNRELYSKARYYIIEKNFGNEKKFDGIHENATRCDSINDINITNGCVLSNELVDNFPVHRVVMKGELMEIFVDHNNGGFKEVLIPASDALTDYFDQLNIHLPEGFQTEVNLQAINWIEEVAAKLEKGFVITIDYGFPSSKLYHEQRRSGTLLCYHKHRINSSPYENIGEQDITSHVNFSALQHWGSKYGLDCCGFTDQASFLRALGLTSHIRVMEQSGRYSVKEIKEKLFFVHNLLMDMGSKLKVLVQQKGMPMQQLSAFASFQTAPAEMAFMR